MWNLQENCEFNGLLRRCYSTAVAHFCAARICAIIIIIAVPIFSAHHCWLTQFAVMRSPTIASTFLFLFGAQSTEKWASNGARHRRAQQQETKMKINEFAVCAHDDMISSDGANHGCDLWVGF